MPSAWRYPPRGCCQDIIVREAFIVVGIVTRKDSVGMNEVSAF